MSAPLNGRAIAEANQAFSANHPELYGRALTAGPEDAAYRAEWTSLYKSAKSKQPTPPAPAAIPKPIPLLTPPSGPTQTCSVVANMTHEEKMEAAIKQAPISDAVRKELPDPKVLVASIVVIGGTLAAIAATGYGAVAEGLAVALLALGALLSGQQIGEGLVDLAKFFEATRCDKAKSLNDLDKASQNFASAVSKVGVGGFNLILTFAGAKGVDNSSGANDLEAMMAKAPAAKLEIDAKAESVAEELQGLVAKAEPKSFESAFRKINTDYDGDASQIKDLARNTIVLKDQQSVNQALNLLKADGATIKNISPELDPLGYSGGAAYVTTESGITAEIQVNTPEMIYGKGPPGYARDVLGNDQFDKIAKKTGEPSGLGHEYYEQYRDLEPGDPQRAVLANKSKEYYDTLRGSQ